MATPVAHRVRWLRRRDDAAFAPVPAQPASGAPPSTGGDPIIDLSHAVGDPDGPAVVIELLDPATDGPSPGGRPHLRVVPDPTDPASEGSRPGLGASVNSPVVPVEVLPSRSPLPPSTSAPVAGAWRRATERRRWRRRLRRTQRAAARAAIARRRHEAWVEYQRQQAERRLGILVGPGGLFDLGSALPITGRTPTDDFVYSTSPPTYGESEDEMRRYAARRVRLLVALGVLFAALAWAWIELGSGWVAGPGLLIGGGGWLG